MATPSQCDHVTEVRAYRFGHRRVVRRQCVVCREAVGPALRGARLDPSFSPRPWLRPFRSSRGNSKKRKYKTYIRSSAWKTRRSATFCRDNWTCRLCGEPATEVHHLTYARLGRERPEDLISVCEDCHREAGGRGSAARTIPIGRGSAQGQAPRQGPHDDSDPQEDRRSLR